MRRVRRFLALGLAMLLTVTGVNLPTGQIQAETETTKQAVATPITSIEYEATVDGVTDETSFEWVSQDGNWTTLNQTVDLPAEGSEITFEQSYSTVSGFINTGYIATIEGSQLTLTINKVIVNGTYELTFDGTKVLKAGSNWENGLPNIWSGLSDGVAFCSSDDAYLAYDATAQLVCFFTYPDEDESEATYEETEITSVKYDATIAGWTDEDSFTWESVASGWNGVNQTVPVTGNGDISFTLTYNYATGFINSGFVDTITDSEMTVTINKVTVNGTYELTFESPKVLKAGSDWENGLPHIWSGLSDGVAYCSSENAYLAYDASADLIKFYVLKAGSKDPENLSDTPSMQYVEAAGISEIPLTGSIPVWMRKTKGKPPGETRSLPKN